MTVRQIPPQPNPLFDCMHVVSAESLLSRRNLILLIDGAPTEAAEAAARLACLAASDGSTVSLMGAGGAEPLPHAAAVLNAAGAAIRWSGLPETGAPISDPARQKAEGEARAASYAQAVAAETNADRRIVVIAPPDGARALVGLAGHTWLPLGARLPAGDTISLRAEASARPGLRLKLRPYEDIPARGAALRYDGLIEVGPDVSAPPRLRGR